jgi:hypothetical protein
MTRAIAIEPERESNGIPASISPGATRTVWEEDPDPGGAVTSARRRPRHPGGEAGMRFMMLLEARVLVGRGGDRT